MLENVPLKEDDRKQETEMSLCCRGFFDTSRSDSERQDDKRGDVFGEEKGQEGLCYSYSGLELF